MPTVATVLGMSAAQAPSIDSIAEFLHERRALLIFDNWANTCSWIRLRSSRAPCCGKVESRTSSPLSREPLRTDGEAVLEIPSLDCYPPGIAAARRGGGDGLLCR